MDTFKLNKHYRFKRDFSLKIDPLEYHGKKGEIVEFGGKSLGYGHFYGIDDHRLILLTTKEAFKYLEEVQRDK